MSPTRRARITPVVGPDLPDTAGLTEPQFRSLVERTSDLILVLEEQGRVVYASPAVRRLGYEPALLVGNCALELVHPDDVELVRQALELVVRSPDAATPLDFRVRRQNGTWCTFEGVGHLLAGDADGHRHVVANLRDVSDRHRAELELRLHAERLATVVQLQQEIAIASVDPAVVMRRVADVARRLTGADGAAVALREGEELVYRAAVGTVTAHVGLRLPMDGSLSGLSARTQQVHYARDAEADNRVNRAIAQCVGARSIATVPLLHEGECMGTVIVLSDTPGRFAEADLHALQLAAGCLAGALNRAAAHEALESAVAERTTALVELGRSEQRFRSAFTHAGIGMALVSLGGRLLQVNPALCQMLGYEEAELLGQDMELVTHPDDRRADLAQLLRLVAGEAESYELEKRYLHREGHAIWGQLNASLVRDDVGRPLYFLGQVVNVTRRKEAEEALRTLSTTDDLTGLLNRRGFMAHAVQQLKLARRTHMPLLLLYLDVDGLKNVNDSFGHAEGDRALVAVARLLRATLRETDIIGRLSGDEFAVLAVNASAAICPTIVGRLERQLDALNALSERPYAISFSLGMASFDPAAPEALEELLARADTAQYAAKNARRAFS